MVPLCTHSLFLEALHMWMQAFSSAANTLPLGVNACQHSCYLG